MHLSTRTLTRQMKTQADMTTEGQKHNKQVSMPLDGTFLRNTVRLTQFESFI